MKNRTHRKAERKAQKAKARMGLPDYARSMQNEETVDVLEDPPRKSIFEKLIYPLVLLLVVYILFGSIAPVVSSLTGSTSGKNTPVEYATVDGGDGGVQTIHMNVTSYGWEPASFALKKGVPVKWVIDGQRITGCNRGIKVPSLGLSFDIKPGIQTIEFTPTQEGTIPWSCWMGMIKGTFIVKSDIDLKNQNAVNAALSEVPAQPRSGGCGCGG